ncbi:MAG: hypothetical protein IKV38_01545, partial [Clostridia bacterium]|nr:hypothetical protein [Clostridia bacterium]
MLKYTYAGETLSLIKLRLHKGARLYGDQAAFFLICGLIVDNRHILLKEQHKCYLFVLIWKYFE